MPKAKTAVRRKPALLDNSPSLVAVRRSRINGRGLFAQGDLPGRRKLGEVEGEPVRLPQAWKTVEGRDKIYLIQLTSRTGLDCSGDRRFAFLNHSCAANCYMRIHNRRVEIYTRRPIPAGTELTVDYGATPHQDGMRCRCGAPGCKGRL